ncbi:hypothetical protein [Agrobacterium sp. El2ro-1b]|uniref:hypothetical protein n=1 Tax=Agrobacterium sp. El2ro-1b TaxID=2969528 RepID=UPI003AB06749
MGGDIDVEDQPNVGGLIEGGDTNDCQLARVLFKCHSGNGVAEYMHHLKPLLSQFDRLLAKPIDIWQLCAA